MFGMSANAVYKLFQKHLDKNDFKYTAHDDDKVITLTANGEDLPVHVIIRVLDDREVVQIISPMTFKMSEDKRIDGAVAVAIANYGMVNGSFDYDVSDGEIRFRTTQSFHGADMNDDTAQYMLAITFSTVDKYNDKFFMLNKGMMSLEQFIEAEKA